MYRLCIRPELFRKEAGPGLGARAKAWGLDLVGADVAATGTRIQGMSNPIDQLGNAFESVPGMRPHLNTAVSSVETALNNPDAFSDVTDKLNAPENQQAISGTMENILADKVPGFLQKSSSWNSRAQREIHEAVGQGVGGIGGQVVGTIGNTVESAIGINNPDTLEKNLTQLSSGSLPQQKMTATTPAGQALEKPIADASRNAVQSSVRSNMDFMPWIGMHMNSMFGKKSNITPDNDIVGAATAGQEIASKITPSTPAMQNLGKNLADTVVNKPFDQFVEQKGNWALKGLHSFTKNPLGGVFDLISSFGDKPEEAAQ